MTDYADAQKQLDALYAELPELECKGLCQDSCGPIGMTKWENARIRRRLKVRQLPPVNEKTMSCPLLTGGKCRVYRVRPMVCRLWALVETMKCPHGCVPDRWLSHGEGKVFLLRADLISAESEEERQLLKDAIQYVHDNPEEFEEQGRQYVEFFDELGRERERRERDALGTSGRRSDDPTRAGVL